MTLLPLRLALVAGLAAPLAFGQIALAQGAPPPAPAASDGMEHHHRDPAERRAMMAEHLRSVLQLTPAQQPALDAFLDAMRPPAGMHEGMEHREAAEDAHLTTPERLDRMQRRMEEMRVRFEAHAAAVKAFYAQLTPSQQGAFDDLAPMLMHHEGHGDHGGDGGHPHMGEGDHGMGPDGPPHG